MTFNYGAGYKVPPMLVFPIGDESIAAFSGNELAVINPTRREMTIIKIAQHVLKADDK
jgi:hypothetical protein